MTDLDTQAIRESTRGLIYIEDGSPASAKLGRVVDTHTPLLDEVERLRAENKRLRERDDIAIARLEIRHGWLVENGYEPDLIDGYGYLPDTDCIPLIQLSTLPGWPDTQPLTAQRDQLHATVAEVEKMTYASDDGAEWEHVDCCEGEPTCPACWAADIRKALRGGQA